MQQLISEYWGLILAVAIPAALIIPAAIRLWREYQEDKRTCGPGCICAGENVRARQQTPVVIQAPQPQGPQIIYLQAPTPQPVYIQAQQPQMVYLPQPQPQIIYLPAPQTAYAPNPQTAQAQQPMSYYPGPEPIIEEYQQPVRYLPAQQPIAYLPPPSADLVEEARRAFEKEKQGRWCR